MRNVYGKIKCTGCGQVVQVLVIKGALRVKEHKFLHPLTHDVARCIGSSQPVWVSREEPEGEADGADAN